jgi:hypothetical protein
VITDKLGKIPDWQHFAADFTMEAARKEIGDSRLKLEKMVNAPVRTFSFPYGVYSEALLETWRAAGYDRVYTTDPIFALRKSDEFSIGRIVVEPTDWEFEFSLKLAGAYRWLKTSSELKQWMLRIFASAKA